MTIASEQRGVEEEMPKEKKVTIKFTKGNRATIVEVCGTVTCSPVITTWL